MYYYHFGDFHVVGRRPRSWCARSRWSTKASPRRRSPSGPWPARARAAQSPEQDKAAEQELVNDPKERAEHVMLIDLARNDIGRIAKTGTVKVTEAFAVERYSHVMHIVSNVEGILNDGMTNMDVLKATFPAGTLTGAPKVHAMELIDQLELTKRGLYGGACGYLSYAGDMDVAIAIRTGLIKDQARCTCRPQPAWWRIRCPSWSGGKPNTRHARCCGPRNWSKKGWSES
jgi:anthranilate synthase component 1